jgi:voltage-gated potassium channel Kch
VESRSKRQVSWRGLLNSLRRRMAQRRWRSARRLAVSGPLWVGLGLVFVAVIVLGTIGFTQYQAGTEGGMDPFTTRLYLSLQLFALESGSVAGTVPWQVELARFAAPLVAAFAILQTMAAVLRTQMEALRLRTVRDHVVVAGLGRKGRILTQALLRRGERVVVIEADDGNAELDSVRSVGGLVVVGDARTPETQRRARVQRASHIVSLCGDDGTNADIAATAREQTGPRRRGSLQCVAQLANPDLCLLLSSEELERYGKAPVRMDFVDVYAAGAHALVRNHPPWLQEETEAPVVMLVGAGTTVRHLLLALARMWPTQGGLRIEHPLHISLVGLEASSLSVLRHSHPELDRLADVDVFDDLRAAIVSAAPTVVYVCPDDDIVATTTALELRGLMAARPARLVVVLEQRAGLGHLLLETPRSRGAPTLEPFAMLEETCQPEVLLTGTTELLARALHNAYLDSRVGAAAIDDPALRPWDQLSEALRESNRDQAAHVAVKLAAIGRSVGPLVDWGTAHDAFSQVEVEIMAQLEHERWVTERSQAGWRLGPRDPQRRTSPYLVPWGQLSDEVRDRDRMFVRNLPGLLASVGLQAHRREAVARGPAPDAAYTQDAAIRSK